jgi:hypothetical protein
MLIAAFTSRSWRQPQFWHAQDRTDSGMVAATAPQVEQVFEDG